VLRDILATHDIEVAFVVTNPDKPFGRKRELTPSPVKALAIEKNIPVFTPAKIRGNTDFLTEIKQIPVDYFIVVAYGKILPKEILDMPHKACINVHGSILPKLRGASPIQSALIQ
jgi:methionyl-tRNA formyltransferase